MMTRHCALLLLSTASFACGGDDGPSSITLEDPTAGFKLAPADVSEIERTVAEGSNAKGMISRDGNTLTISVSESGFACDGPGVGSVTVTITSLTTTELTWQEGEDSTSWTRIDDAPSEPSIVGVWSSNGFYLIIRNDGSATLSGEERCTSGDRNAEGCTELGLFAGDIVVDGDLSDWSAIGQSATLMDAPGDQAGAPGSGSDIRALKFHVNNGRVYVLLQLDGPPNEMFQGRGGEFGAAYRIHLRSNTGSDLFTRIAYNPDASEWYLLDGRAEEEVAAGDSGLEWSTTLDQFGGGVSIVRADIQDCGQSSGSCPYLDELDGCGFANWPG